MRTYYEIRGTTKEVETLIAWLGSCSAAELETPRLQMLVMTPMMQITRRLEGRSGEVSITSLYSFGTDRGLSNTCADSVALITASESRRRIRVVDPSFVDQIYSPDTVTFMIEGAD